MTIRKGLLVYEKEKDYKKTAFSSKSKSLYSAHFCKHIVICFEGTFTNKLYVLFGVYIYIFVYYELFLYYVLYVRIYLTFTIFVQRRKTNINDISMILQ